MLWRGNTIVDISRDFLDTNGVRQSIDVKVAAPLEEENYFNVKYKEKSNIKENWVNNLRDLNVCCQKGLVEMFDSSIGAGTVLMPFGGKYQLTPSEAMAAKIPLIKGETNTGTLMAHGYNPYISQWSPFHGAVYAVIESAAKIVASGGEYRSIRLTFQEYFEKLSKDSEKWGKPFSALLGAFHVQKQLEIPAIGGKDSMSGTFKDINVPPTLVSFAVNVVDVNNVISPEFKKAGSKVILLPCEKDEKWLPKFDLLKRNFDAASRLIKEGKVLAAHTIKHGGVSEAVSKMCFGNKIGFKFTDEINASELFVPNYGSIALEISSDIDLEDELKDIKYELLGYTQEAEQIEVKNEIITFEEILNVWSNPLEDIFPTEYEAEDSSEAREDRENTEYNWNNYEYNQNHTQKSLLFKKAKPTVFIPVFPGTNCEYDTAKAFEKAGANVKTMIFNNLSPEYIIKSVDRMTSIIDNSQIIMLPGGFSAGDEPDGSGKFIATIFRNPKISEAVMNLIKNRDGLMLGICNGFQALIKLGLLPYSEIREIGKDSPTLTYNKIGRHVSCMVQTKVVSNKSPWLSNVKLGDIHTIPVSHGEGRFAANMEVVNELFNKGQVATQYVDFKGNPSYDIKYNPNGSVCAIEGITSEDGRIFGKMGHSERIGHNVYKNIIGEKDQRIFQAGVNYFR
jgi:phosphoribosylformylglycinamidine synthase